MPTTTASTLLVSPPLISNKVLEWLGCSLGLAGAFILALNQPFSGLGFAFFLLSNICWVWFALRINSLGLLLMQLGFTATSVMGLGFWLTK